ncbi:histone-lysine N-methyltransferase [Perkinsela sp. CCAP 1560/4]|nr:histone-lysine N-methyltransferase [Perkinsela sp. CCAP 1560/4]|eukprot:KNH08671.1 histone-lysine N-methyltransferase [Perkinsela sp. CCAP 1560/4]
METRKKRKLASAVKCDALNSRSPSTPTKRRYKIRRAAKGRSHAKQQYKPIVTSVPHRLKRQRFETLLPGVPIGTGTKRDPITIPLRAVPNCTNCYHCPVGIDHCTCQEFEEILSNALDEVYCTSSHRRQHAYGRNPLNSKSVLPVFVARILRLLNIVEKDVFWDLGCGIGNVVMQAALEHGVDAVGIDIQPENVEVAQKTWQKVQAVWKDRHPDRAIGSVCFITGDMFAELAGIQHGTSTQVAPHFHPTKIWMSNQLFTAHMNHQLADFMTNLPSIKAVCAMHDLFPHERIGITQKRNPKPYEKFPIMTDYMTQHNSLEWSATEERMFYVYSPRLEH